MEKPKTRKPKTIQMQYPAQYSQSWASPETQGKTEKLKKKKKNSTLLQQNLFPGCCNRFKPLQGPNPYAPHLKYGIFTNKEKSKMALTKINGSHSLRNSIDPAEKYVDNKGENIKANKDPTTDTPLFVIRPIDKRNRRQLSMSQTMHLDIKPRKYIPHSPRKYSPV